MSEQDETESKLKVTDRRSFTPAGERRNPAPAPDSSPEETSQTIQGEGFIMKDEAESDPARSASGPQVDFTSFVLSLASTAFIHLGEVEDPVSKTRQVDPAMASQMIDIIQMLRDKTAGNLEPKETEFIEGVLYELRMKFTEKVSAV